MRAWALFRHEFRLHIGSTRFQLLSVAGMLLAAIAATIGARDYLFRQAQYTQRVLERQNERVTKPEVRGWTAEPTLRILRPPEPLSVFVRGLDAALPAYWDVSPSGLIEGPPDPSIGQDSEVGEVFDWESVIRIVLGLMALMLAVDSVAGQRASGTLHAVMLQPIRRSVVVACKWLAGTLTLLIAILLVTLTSVMILFATTGSVPTQMVGFLVRSGLVALAYLVSLLGIGLAIGSRANNPERATFAAIATWVFVTLVAPQLVAFGVRAIVPVQLRQSMERDRRDQFDRVLQKTQEALGSALLDLPGATTVQKIDNDENKLRLNAIWRKSAGDSRDIVKNIEARYEQDAEQQRELTRWFARLSPGSLLIELTTDLARTGRQSQAAWNSAAENYQDTLNAALFDDQPNLSLRVPSESGFELRAFQRKPRLDYSKLPLFDRTHSIAPSLSSETTDLAALFAFVAAGLGLGLLLFPRDGL